MQDFCTETVVDNKIIVKDIVENLAALNRNIVSDDFEKSLNYLRKYIDLKIHQYKTGSECWTWNVPPKWRVKDGHIKHNGRKIVSFKDHPLHIMSYSVAVNREMKGDGLLDHIYVHQTIPEAIPYEFSYYSPKWGFCLTHKQRDAIKKDDTYEVFIDSEFVDDDLSVGEYTIKGSSDEYIFFLSHIDHPCQVNDGLIGCAVNVALAKLLEKEDLYYNYTFLFVPETIGSIAYLSHNEDLIPKIKYSIFNETTGLDHPLILQESYEKKGLINKYALHSMEKMQGPSKSYPYLSVLSNDEKIFNGPGINIPSVSVMRVDQEARIREKEKRQKEKGLRANGLVWPYPEYHSHLDTTGTVNFLRAQETVEYLHRLSLVIDRDFIPKRKFKGPVFLSKYNMWIDWRKDYKLSENITWLMYCLEGDMTVFQIAEKLDLEFNDVVETLDQFYKNGLIEKEKISIEFDRAS